MCVGTAPPIRTQTKRNPIAKTGTQHPRHIQTRKRGATPDRQACPGMLPHGGGGGAPKSDRMWKTKTVANEALAGPPVPQALLLRRLVHNQVEKTVVRDLTRALELAVTATTRLLETLLDRRMPHWLHCARKPNTAKSGISGRHVLAPTRVLTVRNARAPPRNKSTLHRLSTMPIRTAHKQDLCEPKRWVCCACFQESPRYAPRRAEELPSQ